MDLEYKWGFSFLILLLYGSQVVLSGSGCHGKNVNGQCIFLVDSNGHVNFHGALEKCEEHNAELLVENTLGKIRAALQLCFMKGNLQLIIPPYSHLQSLLNDQMVQEMEMGRLRMIRMSNIPDTLYMVDDPPPLSDCYAGPACSLSAVGLDILAGAVPVPDSEVVQLMVKREQELRKSASSQRAYQMASANRREINRQIQLRVVREFNLPDTCTDVFQATGYHRFHQEQAPRPTVATHYSSSSSTSFNNTPHRPPPPPTQVCLPAMVTAPSISRSLRYATPENNMYKPYEPDIGSCSEGHLSDIMPDIAMATASVNHLQISDSSATTAELDLGDGTNHSNSSPSMFL